jgi:hypothetical protein
MALPKNKKLPKKGSSGPSQGIPPRTKNPNQGTGPKAHKGKGGKGPMGMPKKFGGLGGYPGVNTSLVNQLVNGIIRGELNDIRKDRRQVRRESRNMRNQARRDYRRGVNDLNHVFGETDDYLGFLNNQNQQTITGARSNAELATQALQQALGGTYAGAQADGTAELERLGIEGGGNFGQLIADNANAQNVALQSGANTDSTLGLMGANADQMGSLLRGMNQGSYMSHIGKNLNARNDKLAEIQQNKIDGYNKVREAMSDAKGSRRDLFIQLLTQLQQTGWNQYLQNRQLKR